MIINIAILSKEDLMICY